MRTAEDLGHGLSACVPVASPARRWLYLAGAVCAGLCMAALFTRLFVFEPLMATLAERFSSDGVISLRNRQRIGVLLIELAIWFAIGAALLGALATPRGTTLARTWLRTDHLRRMWGAAPDPMRVLTVSALSSAIIMLLWLVHRWSPLDLMVLFVKEGPLELLTAVLLVMAAVWCGIAAWRRRKAAVGRVDRAIWMSYAVLAAGLFAIGMEEISWGQTYLQWETPSGWAAINDQQETTLHNLLSQQTLKVVSDVAMVAFALLTLGAIALGMRARHPFIVALAPHASLAAVVILMGYSIRLYLEVSEALFAIFAACYAWRVYVATRGPRRAA